MADNKTDKAKKTKNIVVLIACILIGITFLVSATGKLIPAEEGWALPGQTIDFIARLLPASWIMSEAFQFAYNVLIPVIVPAIELALGVFLLIGFLPRLMAVITLPITLLFMTENSFALYLGTGQFGSCSCFGFWENLFGSLTPVQSLVYDIVLFGLALVIIILYQGGFLQSRTTLKNLGRKKKSQTKEEKK